MTPDLLCKAARHFETPLYVYDVSAIRDRIGKLKDLFSGRFGVSYAIKSNPNMGLLKALSPELSTFDASSYSEVLRALDAGMPPENITFSGPAKRPQEIKGAVDHAIGELVIETLSEAQAASDYAATIGRQQSCLLRINPLTVPRKFGASMAGTASQFGIDEEDLETALPVIQNLPGLKLIGFHIYSGTNSLDAHAIAENFGIFASIFRKAQEIAGIEPTRLVFGSGFGIPYLPDETELDHAALPALINPIIDTLLSEPAFGKASCNLELGRWLVGPYGWLLTGVISEKQSRGAHVVACDAGFNNHLAACGMMGSVFRRNWVYENVSSPDAPVKNYTLVGPLCTTIDRLAVDVALPTLSTGDVISIPSSGAYGITASPTKFISHPEPREVLWDDDSFTDVSETLLNHWPTRSD